VEGAANAFEAAASAFVKLSVVVVVAAVAVVVAVVVAVAAVPCVAVLCKMRPVVHFPDYTDCNHCDGRLAASRRLEPASNNAY
jgi:hypothetical protein